MQKGTPSRHNNAPTACRQTGSGSISSLLGVLFTFPSRYWFAIGLSGVFSLTGWAPQFHARFSCPALLRMSFNRQSYGFSYDRFFQGVPLDSILPRRGPTTPVSPRRHGLGSSVFARHYLRNHCLFSPSYGYLDVSSPRSPPLTG